MLDLDQFRPSAEWLQFLPLALAVLRPPEEADLITRLQRRDAEAAREIYDRYGRVVYSLTLRIVRDPSIAEDLVQETMLRVFNRIIFFDAERGTLTAWVLAVARNQAIDYLRSAGNRQRSSELKLEGIDDPGLFTDLGVGEAEILRFDQIQKVRQALDKLNSNQRLVIELAYFEGLTQTEMAARLSQPLGTVKTWVRTALKTMREALEEMAVTA